MLEALEYSFKFYCLASIKVSRIDLVLSLIQFSGLTWITRDQSNVVWIRGLVLKYIEYMSMRSR